MKPTLALALLCTAVTAQAQTWPSRPIRFIVAETPTVPQDTISRGMIEPLSKALNQSVFVENRAGADGIIGTEACARAAPDGYTMCATASNVIVWNTVLRKKLPYDAVKDFAPVVHTGFFESLLVVNPSVSAKRPQELFDVSKANPNKVNWGHFGVNSTGYMYMEWLNRNRGTSFYPVPYKGPAQNTQALVAGETSAAVTALTTTMPLIRAGKLKALAVTSSKRLAFLPDVPTFEEEGIKLPLRTWFGYHYQAAVPKELVTRMNGELRRILESPSFRNDIIDKVYVNLNTGTPEEFDAFVRDQIRSVRELVAGIGIKPED
jgi:tripartite-type tricarboxylate transporter receptor subunit TctC